MTRCHSCVAQSLGHLGGLLCGALFGLLVPMYKPITTLALDPDARKD